MQKQFPTEKKVKHDVNRFKKKFFPDTTLQQELRKRNLALIWVMLNFIILLGFLFSEVFWSAFNIIDPTIQGYFVLNSCSTRTFSDCTFEIYGNSAVLSLNPGTYKIQQITIKECDDSIIHENGTLYLFNCSFSSVSNNLDITVDYLNPESGLVHTEKIKVIKTFEMTTIKKLSSDGFNKISSFVTNPREKSNTYK